VQDCDIFCCLHDRMQRDELPLWCYGTELVYATTSYVEWNRRLLGPVTLGVDFISSSSSNSHCHFSQIYEQSQYQILLEKGYERSEPGQMGRDDWDLEKKKGPNAGNRCCLSCQQTLYALFAL